MKLTVVQFAPEFGEKEKNLKKIDDYAHIKTDIIVFPELATTGYFFINREETTLYAEPFSGKSVSLMQSVSTSTKKIIVFGFAELYGDKIYNSAAILFPNKNQSCVYRKSHLFYREFQCFSPGDTGFFTVYSEEFDLHLGTMICYDWRFPEAARTLALNGADLIVCPSNLVTDVWHISMPSRALENKVYFAVANRTGIEEREEESLLFKGASAIYSYNGSEMIKADATEETFLTVEFEPDKTRNKSFNQFNDIFKDRRKDLYL